ncbi:MAG TPA: HIT family protein [Candidatus Binatia bacterium]|jgi:histidine triad (HIT) family protein|nr:HIT family protein [Candidatus Binatia bacterium]
MSCIFCRIVAGEVPAEVVARTPTVVAFLDVQPLADGHVLVVPRAHVPAVEDLEPADADDLFREVVRLARPVREALRAEGTTIGVNNGEATGQAIPHVHVHIVPRRTGDGAGSIHTIFPRHASRPLAEIGAAIRRAAGDHQGDLGLT